MESRTKAERSARRAPGSRPVGQKRSRQSYSKLGTAWAITFARFERADSPSRPRHQPRTSMLKLALFVLNARANDDDHPGECWASIETLSHDAGIRSPRSMQYALRELERLGCVERREPGWKGRATATYIIRIGQLQAIGAVDEKVKSRQRSAELEQLDELDAQELETPAPDSFTRPSDVPAQDGQHNPDGSAREPAGDCAPSRELEPSTARDSDSWAIVWGRYCERLKGRWGEDAEAIDRVPAALRAQLITRTHGLARKYARNNETIAEGFARCADRVLLHFFRRDRKALLERHHPLEFIDGDADVIFADVGRELAAKRAQETPPDVRYVDVPVFTEEQLAAAGKARREPVRRTLSTRSACADIMAALSPTGTGE